MKRSIAGTGFAFLQIIRRARAQSSGPLTQLSKKTRWTLLSMALIGGCLMKSSIGEAFTQETAASPQLEKQFLAATTNQFLATLIPNPLAANTYTLKLLGLNPSFNAPPTTLEQALSLGSTLYVYGFASGMNYQQHVHNNLVETYEVNCSTPIGSSTSTWDIGTCQAVTGAIDNAIFQESLSTPTVLPPLGF